MSAPLRIRRVSGKSGIGESESLKPYLDRLLKLIPAEVLSLYAVGTGFIQDAQGLLSILWAIFCLGGVVAVKCLGTADNKRSVAPDWIHVGISATAFCIWVYYLGGPFEAVGWYSKPTGSLLILAFTFASPYLYRGPVDG